MTAPRHDQGCYRARAGGMLALLASTLLVGSAPAAITTRPIEFFAAEPSRQISPRVAIDGNRFVVAYAGAPAAPLRIATLDCTGVQIQTAVDGDVYLADMEIDSLGQFNLVHRNKTYAEICFTLDSVQLAQPITVRLPGTQVSNPYRLAMALDSKDRPYIVAIHASGYLMTSVFEIQRGVWVTEVLTGIPRLTGDRPSPAIAIDPQDRPVIAYLDPSRNLVVMTRDEGAWIRRSTPPFAHSDLGTAAACSSDGLILVAANSEGYLRLFRFHELGVTVENVIGETTPCFVGPHSMTVDASGTIRIAFQQYEGGTWTVRLAEKAAAEWTITTIASNGVRSPVTGPSMDVGPDGAWVASWYDNAARAVYVAGPTVPPAITGEHALLAGRWSQCMGGENLPRPGGAIHASSWDGASLAGAWDLSGLGTSSVEEIGNTVDPEGNGEITWRVSYAGQPTGTLVAAGPQDGCNGSDAIAIESYVQTMVVRMVAGQPDWLDSSFWIEGAGHFSSYPQYAVKVAGVGGFDGSGPIPPDYPDVTCFYGAPATPYWGSITSFGIQITDCAVDDDLDHLPNCADNCPMTANTDQHDADDDGIGDPCDPDLDGDTIFDDGEESGIAGDNRCTGGAVIGCDDNCRFAPNPDQADGDADGVGDLCDNCPGAGNADQGDADGDSVGDACDTCPATIPGVPVDATGCPPTVPGDLDHDGDVDLADTGVFTGCATRAGVPALPECMGSDPDLDGDVDMDDFAVVQRCLRGENLPGDPACAD